MLVPLSNTPRDYAWGSTTLLADLEGREPTEVREAEVWFGDHLGSPARTADGRTLDQWLSDPPAGAQAPQRLPYLLKLLAAASPLSIQAHPSLTQAAIGFAREEAAGIPVDAPDRTYRDANHKPELIVAVSDRFLALAGLRPLDASLRLLAAIGPAADGLAVRLRGADDSPVAAIAWLLSSDAAADVAAIIDAARTAESAEFAAELELACSIDAEYPGDAGIVVALLMNFLTLRKGDGLFLPAGVLHAYLSGLGVELMAASDNVLRGGLTPKHIDVDELLVVLTPETGVPPIVVGSPVSAGVSRYTVPVDDFALLVAHSAEGASATLPVAGIAIAVATEGSPTIVGARSGARHTLAPGTAVLVTQDEQELLVEGEGVVFLATPGQ
ncbi:mannose-6-phosphate isomerase, class I [Microbacterium lacus]|uniref:mannose-6-phosphate isomerase, class I n=1 Tax=Microbacterium lacus TaxID=415217 RepID=UPI00384C54C8